MYHCKCSRMEKDVKNPMYARPVMEFLTIATEYCAMLEQSEGRSRGELLADLLRLLPVLYWHAQVLTPMETEGQFLPDDKVTEQDYDYIRETVRGLLGDWDEYEDLVMDEASGREECRWVSMSEQLADVYQPLRNFVWVYQQRLEQCMQDALWAVRDSFELYWGQNVVDTLRRLHRLKYTMERGNDEDNI